MRVDDRDGLVEAIGISAAYAYSIVAVAWLSRLSAEQLALDLADGGGEPPGAANDDVPPSAGAEKQRRKKAECNIGRLPEHLPRCERVIEPATTLCPCCNGRMHRLGEDVSETLDRVPAVLRVLRTIRPKYACRACEGAVVQAPAPARLIEGGMVSTALIAHIAVAKYGWLSTLYRQTAILAGQGVVVDRQTLARWMKQTAWMLKGGSTICNWRRCIVVRGCSATKRRCPCSRPAA